MADQLLIYTPQETERIRYSFQLVLGQLLQVPYRITTQQEDCAAHNGPVLCYTSRPMEGFVWLGSHGLLQEKGLREQEIVVFDFQDTKAFFAQSDQSLLPFDVFAATFFMVSRYEEYLPFIKDQHNRFTAPQSIAWQKGFLHQPVVNKWAEALRQVLLELWPSIPNKKSKYTVVPTYDIDIAWSYRHKGLVRSLAGLAKSVSSLQMNDLYYRLGTHLRLMQDPYYTFDYLRKLQHQYQYHPVYFFLVGEFGEFDKNIDIHEPAYQLLMKDIADYATTGIHPSYASNQQPARVSAEKQQLEEVLKRPVTHSRQHYLMLSLPDTYQRLIELDIQHDYTLGYTSDAGFRAGICSPYPFYNLHLESATALTLHPFALMDSVYRYYLKLAPREVLEAAKPIIDEVKNVGGTLYTLWHNNSFSEAMEWKGWRKPYEQILRYAMQ